MNYPVINSTAGQLIGNIQQSYEGVDYYSFKGIPYARPPIGPLRFQDPLPAESWEGTRDAKDYGPVCAQTDFKGKVVGGDDCLYLNVYKRATPAKHITQLLPVMVWIYGGAFIFGDGNDIWYGPDYFMNKDVVLVTFNYRLGVLGFLNLEHQVAPGNQGLKDQVMALKWVRDNIRNFDGDPDNVMIFGESAGAMSVHYLALSSLANGFFHKAIMQSGTIYSPVGRLIENPKDYAHRLSEMLGNNTKDPEATVEFLRSIDIHNLIEAQKKLKTNEEKVKGILTFGPGIDAASENPLMPIDPAQAAKEGIKVPLIIGHNNREGIFIGEGIKKMVQPSSLISKSNFEKYLHPNIISMIKEYGLSTENLRLLYFGNETKVCDEKSSLTEEEILEKIIDYVTEMYFHYGTHQVLSAQIKKSFAGTFFYQYTYDMTPSPIKLLTHSTNVKGASHADELQHLFRMKVFEAFHKPPKKDSEVYKITTQMIELWTNFAKTGSPSPKPSDLVPIAWPSVENNKIEYLRINENISVQPFELSDRLKKFFSPPELVHNPDSICP